jgi:hypothetical protein
LDEARVRAEHVDGGARLRVTRAALEQRRRRDAAPPELAADVEICH